VCIGFRRREGRSAGSTVSPFISQQPGSGEVLERSFVEKRVIHSRNARGYRRAVEVELAPRLVDGTKRRGTEAGLRSLVMKNSVRTGLIIGLLLAGLAATASPARAVDRLCDP